MSLPTRNATGAPASSRPGKRTVARRATTRYVRSTLDSSSSPRLTAAEEARLAAMTDDDIDYSDIPDQAEVPLEQWKTPRELVSGENKSQLTLRLDADVVKFFRKSGNRYQTRMNAVLREYMLAHKRAG